MRHYSLLIVILLILPISFAAQNKLSFDEAINLAYQNNIELQKQSAQMKFADSKLDETARMPNPIFSFSREDLKSGELEYDEWIASGSIPLNFLWDRWSNVNSKEKASKVEELLYENLRTHISAKVKENYFAFNNYERLSNEFIVFLHELDKLIENTRLRLSEEDISDYELRRILVEVNKIRSTVAEIELKKNKYENDLKLLTGMESDKELFVEQIPIFTNLNFNLEELVTIAFKNRKDLQALEMMVESEESSLSYNQMKIIPEMSLSAGYKEQADNYSGTIFQFNIGIPLFDRNQAGIEHAEIQLNLLSRELMFTKEKIRLEVREVFTNYNMKKSLYESAAANDLESIFTTAVYSYEQGEISLVNFIDGINAYVSGSILNTELQSDLYTSLFQLEKAVCKSLINFEN